MQAKIQQLQYKKRAKVQTAQNLQEEELLLPVPVQEEDQVPVPAAIVQLAMTQEEDRLPVTAPAVPTLVPVTLVTVEEDMFLRRLHQLRPRRPISQAVLTIEQRIITNMQRLTTAVAHSVINCRLVLD